MRRVVDQRHLIFARWLSGKSLDEVITSRAGPWRRLMTVQASGFDAFGGGDLQQPGGSQQPLVQRAKHRRAMVVGDSEV